MNDEYDFIPRFWFGYDDLDFLDSREYSKQYKDDLWRSKDPETGKLIKEKFSEILEKANRGALKYWELTARGSIALILLFDQFPRRIYSGTPQMFAEYENAFEIAVVLEKTQFKFDDLSLIERMFVYDCLLQKEDEDNVMKAMYGLRLMYERAKPADDKALIKKFFDASLKQLDVLTKFGRYPERNAILGRESTPEEIEFLKSAEGEEYLKALYPL